MDVSAENTEALTKPAAPFSLSTAIFKSLTKSNPLIFEIDIYFDESETVSYKLTSPGFGESITFSAITPSTLSEIFPTTSSISSS